MPRISPRPTYNLGAVKKLVREGKCEFTRNAINRARKDFGWGPEEIKNCILSLTGSHFDKPDSADWDQYLVFDIYKARKVYQNKDVYLHFYITDQGTLLIINSCHRLN